MIPTHIPLLRNTETHAFFLIAGPCVVENRQMPYEIAARILEMTDALGIPFIFKASYKKANRTSLHSFTGIGDEAALETLAGVREKLKIPVITDFHSAEEASLAARYVDVLQVPAFLCRQTDLLIAAAATGKTINIKKGQFLSPEAMKHAVEKITAAGNPHVMLTERGSMFGYTDLVVDFRSIPRMQAFGVPVVVDITHSLQQPNTGGVTGGLPHFISTLGRAAIASGADGIFLETHPEPSKALSDGANMLPLNQLEDMLKTLVRIRQAIAP
ncbi:MAG: 3-deoxy-8-phosphooctulonate synthase [Bacteroidales bacterium]